MGKGHTTTPITSTMIKQQYLEIKPKGKNHMGHSSKEGPN